MQRTLETNWKNLQNVWIMSSFETSYFPYGIYCYLFMCCMSLSLSLCFSPIFVGPTLHGNYGVILHTQILLLDNTLYASLCIAHAKDAHKMHMCVLCAHQICEVQAVNILVPMAQVSRNICMKWTYAPANTEPNQTNIRNVKPIEHIGKEAKETRWEMKHDANAHIAHCLPKFRLIGV